MLPGPETPVVIITPTSTTGEDPATLSTKDIALSSLWFVGGRMHVHPAAQSAFRDAGRPVQQVQQLRPPRVFCADRTWHQGVAFLSEDMRT